MSDIFDHRLIINTGKGGVGKTVISAAYAFAAARQGKRVLLVQLGVKEKVSRIFGSSPVGVEPVEVEENLFSINVTPEAALEEYLVLKLRLKSLYKAVFENRFIHSFIRLLPGLHELNQLGKVWYELQATRSHRRPKWDLIVVDCHATGHGLFLLQSPAVIMNMISSGAMYQEAKKLYDMLKAETTVLNLVTLVEEMPVNETIELRQILRDELNIKLGYVVANAVYEPRFGAATALTTARQAWPHDGSPTDQLLEAGMFRHSRVELQAHYLERLKAELSMPLIEVPYYFTEHFNFQTISKIADDIERQSDKGRG